MKNLQIVSKAIIVHNGKVLLLLRDNIPTIYAPNKWSLPGGGGENGESPKQTLFRELKEEIDIAPKNFSFLGEFQDTARREADFLYFAKLTDKEARRLKLGDEGQKMEFFSFDELKNLDIASKSASYLKKYVEKLIPKSP